MKFLPQLSIKLRLNIITGLSLLSIAILFTIWNSSAVKLERLNSASITSADIMTKFYKLRKYESDFLQYKNSYYVDQFNKEFFALKKSITKLNRQLEGTRFSSDKIVKLKAHLSDYKKIFFQLVDIDKKIGLDDNSGLLSKLNFTKNRLDVKLAELKGDFFKEEFLRLQLDEKKFLSSRDPRYADFFDEDYEFMHEKIVKTNLYNKTRKDIIFFLSEYKKSFDIVVETIGIRGINRDVGIRGDFKTSIYKLSEYTQKFRASVNRSIEKEKSSINFINNAVLSVISITLLVLMVLIFSRVKKSIAEILRISQNLSSEDKDLRKRVTISSGDEMEEVAKNVNRFIDETQKSLLKTKKTSKAYNDMSQQLNKLSTDIRDKFEKEDFLIKETTSQVHSFRLTIEQVSYALKELSESVLSSKESIKKGVEELSILKDATADGDRVSGELYERYKELLVNSNEIKSVLNSVSLLSEDVSLLAINAAVEASKAGEDGEGFSIIADKMRVLSSDTEEKLSSIDSVALLMASLLKDLNAKIENNREQLLILDKRVSNVVNDMSGVANSTNSLSETVDSFIGQSSKLINDSNSIVETIESVDKLSSENKSSAITVYTTSVRLNDLSDELETELKRFKT